MVLVALIVTIGAWLVPIRGRTDGRMRKVAIPTPKHALLDDWKRMDTRVGRRVRRRGRVRLH